MLFGRVGSNCSLEEIVKRKLVASYTFHTCHSYIGSACLISGSSY